MASIDISTIHQTSLEALRAHGAGDTQAHAMADADLNVLNIIG